MHVHLKFQILAQLVDLMIMQSDVKSRTFSVVVPYVVVCFHNAHAFYMTCSRFLLHEPNRKKTNKENWHFNCFTLYQTSSEEQWIESTKRKSVTMCVSAVLRILLLLPTSQLFTVFAHKRKTWCQLMLHNSNTVRILYENTHIFEKLMNSAFKPNQVWYNQMSQSCHIMYSGKHESSRIGLIFDFTAWKGWNKKIQNWSVSVLLHCCIF